MYSTTRNFRFFTLLPANNGKHFFLQVILRTSLPDIIFVGNYGSSSSNVSQSVVVVELSEKDMKMNKSTLFVLFATIFVADVLCLPQQRGYGGGGGNRGGGLTIQIVKAPARRPCR